MLSSTLKNVYIKKRGAKPVSEGPNFSTSFAHNDMPRKAYARG